MHTYGNGRTFLASWYQCDKHKVLTKLPSTAASRLRMKGSCHPKKWSCCLMDAYSLLGVAYPTWIPWLCLSGSSQINLALRWLPFQFTLTSLGICCKYCIVLSLWVWGMGSWVVEPLLCWGQSSPMTLESLAELWLPVQTPLFSCKLSVGALSVLPGHRSQSRVPQPTSAGFSDFQNWEARA